MTLFRAWHLLATTLWAAAVATVGGCGGGSDAVPATSSASASMGREGFPLAVGDRWVYRSWSNDAVAASQVLLFKATESTSVQGVPVVVVRSSKAIDGSADGAHFLAVTDAAVTELPDPAVPAGSLRLPAMDLLRFPLVAGGAYQQIDQTFDAGGDFDGDGHNESLHIVANVSTIGAESVQTDAGRLEDCMHVRTVVMQTGIYTGGSPPVTTTTVVDDWYAAGIGLVREDSRTGSFHGGTTSKHLTLVGYSVGGVRSETTPPKATLLKPSGTQGPFTVIELGFSEVMDVSTVTSDTVQLRDGAGLRIPVSMTRGPSSFAFYPADGPLATSRYTVSVGGGAMDLVGNAVEANSWSFDVDATAPVIVATTPADQAGYVPIDAAVTFDFSEEIDPASASGAVQMLSTTYLPVDVSVSGKRLTVRPRSPLAMRTAYEVLVQPLIRDKVGNVMATTFNLHFKTDPGQFDYAGSLRVGSSPKAVAIGDVNGDGRNDVVMTNGYYFDPSTDYRLFVFPQLADGTLGAPVSYATQANYGCLPSAVAVADINGDGRKDVLIAEGGCGIEVLLQNARGELVSSMFLPSPESRMMRVVDLDGDGRLDIVGVGVGTNQVAVWKQAADGTLNGPSLYSLEHGGWEDLAVGDVNGDGRVDIVVSSGGGVPGKEIGILTQQPDGSFGSPRYIAIGTQVASVAVGDVNGDGRDDIIVGRWFAGSIGVIYQGASGELGTPRDLAAINAVEAIEVADIDGDGRKDVVVKTGYGFGVYRQRSDGTLTALQTYDAPLFTSFEPQAIAVGDINGDGLPDLVGAGLTYVLNLGSRPAGGVASGAQAANAMRLPGSAQASQRSWAPASRLPVVDRPASN